MSYNPKVTNVTRINDEPYTPAKIRLVLDRDKQKEVDANKLHQKESLGKATEFKPFLVSETEAIAIDDKFLDIVAKKVKVLKKEGSRYNSYRDRYKKILALPDQISKRDKERIRRGFLKNKDDVLLKCVKHANTVGTGGIHPVGSVGHIGPTFEHMTWHVVGLDEDNYVTIRKE